MASANDGHLDEVAITIRQRLQGHSPPSDCCIFPVPERLRKNNQDAYTPHTVAIGPYHRSNPRLRSMEDHKLLYLQNFFMEDNRLEDYIAMVKSWENEAQSCYDEKTYLNSNDFAEMMLLDGIFVIQIFLMFEDHGRILPNDRIFSKPRMLKEVRRDMTLLENQIPFFVIQRLFIMAFRRDRPERLLELMYKFFSPVVQVETLPEAARHRKVKHIIDALWLSFLPSMNEASHGSDEPINFIPSATELVAAGVKLRKGESKRFFDIEFKNGELKIPRLVLYERTASLFRNILAFEECYCQEISSLTSYMVFMDHLVDTAADTELLMDTGIMENGLSDKESATYLINAWSEETSMSRYEYHFYDLSNELVKHYQRPYNKWKTMLKRDYCSNPWTVISVMAASVLLLLTVTQTVCSVLSLA